MDSLITAAGRALAAGDPLGAPNRVGGERRPQADSSYMSHAAAALNPSASSVARTFGRAATRAMKAERFG
jgi:hypothetical protein